MAGSCGLAGVAGAGVAAGALGVAAVPPQAPSSSNTGSSPLTRSPSNRVGVGYLLEEIALRLQTFCAQK